jgi:hypothetical protein
MPLGGADEQGPPVRADEHQRERRPVLLEFDLLQDRAALGEHPPPRQPAVAVDAERGEPARERLGDDQRPAVRSDAKPLGNWMSPATWRGCPSGVTSLI